MSAPVSASVRVKTPVLTAVGSNGVSHVRKVMECSESVLRIVQVTVVFSGPAANCTCSDSGDAISGDVALELPDGTDVAKEEGWWM